MNTAHILEFERNINNRKIGHSFIIEDLDVDGMINRSFIIFGHCNHFVKDPN